MNAKIIDTLFAMFQSHKKMIDSQSILPVIEIVSSVSERMADSIWKFIVLVYFKLNS